MIRYICDVIFSFGTFLILALAGFLYIMYLAVNAVNDDMENQEKRRAQTEYCYSQLMILVETDAGTRCVAPQSLVRVK